MKLYIEPIVTSGLAIFLSLWDRYYKNAIKHHFSVKAAIVSHRHVTWASTAENVIFGAITYLIYVAVNFAVCNVSRTKGNLEPFVIVAGLMILSVPISYYIMCKFSVDIDGYYREKRYWAYTLDISCFILSLVYWVVLITIFHYADDILASLNTYLLTNKITIER